ncbi:hypothetical protein G5V59_20625 [Nocardioides sp. W3-2-3]|uniref:hypothetical protein n=1 Tax=Nocardioides convexus TaxID=2712224 RepID=UPI0024184E6B|nr:hypothetical protein [Nocardioides convexus]NHA01424.1 hypothetical protein [Nocardioides convexus]
MTRSHKEWGLKRSDVEGQWVRLVRRAQKAKGDLVFSQSLLAGATPEQVALLVDALVGHQVNVVVTTGIDDEADTITRWISAVRKPERLHVLETDGLEAKDVWKAFGKARRLRYVVPAPRRGSPRHAGVPVPARGAARAWSAWPAATPPSRSGSRSLDRKRRRAQAQSSARSPDPVGVNPP